MEIPRPFRPRNEGNEPRHSNESRTDGDGNSTKMNSLVARPIAFPLLVAMGLAMFLLPLAVWHQGESGLWIVASAVGVVASIVVLTAFTQQLLPDLTPHPLKKLAIVGGLRMGLSLAAVLAVILTSHQFAQPEALLYAVPFYLGLLAAETAVMVDQIKKNSGGVSPAPR